MIPDAMKINRTANACVGLEFIPSDMPAGLTDPMHCCYCISLILVFQVVKYAIETLIPNIIAYFVQVVHNDHNYYGFQFFIFLSLMLATV